MQDLPTIMFMKEDEKSEGFSQRNENDASANCNIIYV